MTIVYRLVGYDRRTRRLGVMYDVPPAKLALVREMAGVLPDHDGLGSYRLDASQARDIAGLLGERIDTDAFQFSFEPFDEPEKKRGGFLSGLFRH
jgi:hypothetical protein